MFGDSSKKMYELAKYLDDLSPETNTYKGYGRSNAGKCGGATIYRWHLGMAVWLMLKDSGALEIVLSITPNAEEKYPTDCQLATDCFKKLFKDTVRLHSWEHGDGSRPSYKDYTVDVTDMPIREIEELTDNIKAMGEATRRTRRCS